MKRRLTDNIMAIFSIVYIVLFALCALGQEQALSPIVATSLATPVPVVPKPSTLPDRLPIGSPEIVREWAVTNRQFVRLMSSTLTYTNINGQRASRLKPGDGDGINFRSYAHFVEHVTSNSLAGIEKCKIDADPNTEVQLEVNMINDEASSALVIRTNLGKISTINTKTFQNLQPSKIWVSFRIPGLERLEIQSDEFEPTLGHYWYTWENGVNNASWVKYGYATQMIRGTANATYLDHRFIFGTNWIRFKITANGSTAVYTQNGEQVSKVKTVIIGNRVSAMLPAGADYRDYDSISLQSSVNGADWTQRHNFTSKNDQLEIDPISPLELFRIRAELKSQLR